MGGSESGCPALSLQECVAKARELTRLKQADPTYRIMFRVWVDQYGADGRAWKTRKRLDEFLRRPDSSAFSMLQRAWHKAFLKFHLAVAIERLKG